MASRGETTRLKRIEDKLDELLALARGTTSTQAAPRAPTTPAPAPRAPAPPAPAQAAAPGAPQVLTTRPVPGSNGKPAPAPVDETPLLAWLRNAEQTIPQIREHLSRGRKNPALSKRAVREAEQELVRLANALGEAGVDENLVVAVEAAAAAVPRVRVLHELLVRAAAERI